MDGVGDLRDDQMTSEAAAASAITQRPVSTLALGARRSAARAARNPSPSGTTAAARGATLPDRDRLAAGRPASTDIARAP
jgi:hypothetical protein